MKHVLLALIVLASIWTSPVSAKDLPDVSTLFESQKNSVVFIRTEVVDNNALNLFNLKLPAKVGQGSGFVVDSGGHIITNFHVVKGATRIQVGLQNGESHEAHLVGTDSQTDIALLKIDTATQLSPVRLGSSSKLKVGEWVVAIGNPFGLDHSVTAGIISAKGREIGAGPYDNFLQTDASINPGNSGGPLFNMAGEVVGVNTAIIADGQGIGFAVPMDMVKDIVDQLKSTGYVLRGYLGVKTQRLTALLGQTYGLREDAGVLISSVERGGPAHKGGLKSGDILTHIGAREVRTPKGLRIAIAASRPGSSVTLNVLRQKKKHVLEVRMAGQKEAPKTRNTVRKQAQPKVVDAGIYVQKVDNKIARHFRVRSGHGVIVAGVVANGPASGVLRRGDIVLEIGNESVNNKTAFKRAINQKSAVRLKILREGEISFVALKVRR